MIQLQIATLEDSEAVLRLHAKYHIDTISQVDKKDGFVTTPFDEAILAELIAQNGLFIAKEGEVVLAYVMAASWQFCSRWPIFEKMIEGLPSLQYANQTLSVDNSYQYGPICIDKSLRGTAVLKDIFEFARVEMAKRYPILVTFVNQVNPRSFAAHTRKLGLDVIGEFEFNGNQYWELAYETSQPLA